MQPFGSHNKNKTNSKSVNEEVFQFSDDDDLEHPDEQILGYGVASDSHVSFLLLMVTTLYSLSKEIDVGSGNEDEENDGNESVEDRTLASRLIDNDEVELETTDVNDYSNEDEEDCYTSKSCMKTLEKVCLHS
jgi:hypothetical protein